MRSCCKFLLERPVSRPLILEYRRSVPALFEELHELDLATEDFQEYSKCVRSAFEVRSKYVRSTFGVVSSPVSEELIPLGGLAERLQDIPPKVFLKEGCPDDKIQRSPPCRKTHPYAKNFILS